MSLEAWIVVDLGFGDSGKGTVTDFLVRDRRASLVVRFNGGAQAGHNVVTPDGRHHTFSQLGAGSFVDETRTLLGPAFVLHPGALLVEAKCLESKGVPRILDRVSVDERALVITPFHQAAGRLRELARTVRHGTAGVGLGETVGDSSTHSAEAIRAADLADSRKVLEKLHAVRARKLDELAHIRSIRDPRATLEWQILDDPDVPTRALAIFRECSARVHVVPEARTHALIQSAGSVVFEGAQGILLDERFGFQPHTTWSDCTTAGARSLLRDLDIDVSVCSFGVTRTYTTRHGEGPLPTRDARLRPEPHNDDHGWQGPFRTGVLDLVLLRHAIRVSGGIDGLALTHLDRDETHVCHAYRKPDGSLLEDIDASTHFDGLTPVVEESKTSVVERIEQRVLLESRGMTANEKTWR